MKDLIQVWNRVAGRTYSAVNTGAQENSEKSVKEHTYKFSDVKQTKSNKKFIVCIILSAISLITGLFIYFVNPYDLVFDYKVKFGDGGEIFEMWRKPEVELFLRVYLFNITNAEDFMSGKDEKIKFDQVGPYVYKELIEHGNITFNDNGTLSTLPKHPLEWQADYSAPRTEDDILILPNIAYLCIAHIGGDRNILFRMGLNTLLTTTKDKPLVKMTAKEFMFGYATSLVTLGNNLLPGWIKFDKLGLIDRMYDFNGDFETVYTGNSGNVSETGLIDTWRGSRSLPHWGDTDCAQVHKASDGSKFRGKLQSNESILFYRKSLCRAAPMVKAEEGYKGDLLAYKYVFEENMLDNGLKDPKNKCFCRYGNCLKEGLIDVTDCYYGFPIALSYPHFLDADPTITDKMEGVKANRELHGSHIWIQPRSGLPLEVNVKFQINMALGNLKGIYGAKPFSDMVLPMLWFEFRMFQLPNSMANRFKLYLKILPEGEKVLMWIGFLISGPLLAAAILLKLKRTNDCPKTRKVILWDDNSSYAKSLRRVSLEIEKSKMQSVYIPCELPLEEHQDSDSPFLHSSDKNSSESDTEIEISTDKKHSSIRSHAERIKNMGLNFGSKLQDNMDEIGKNIKNLTSKLGSEKSTNSLCESNSYQSSEEENNLESRRFSVPMDILGTINYNMVETSSSDDEGCNVEIVEDDSEFAPTTEEIIRRMSIEIETCNKINRLNELEMNTDI